MNTISLFIGHNVNGTPALSSDEIITETCNTLQIDGLTVREAQGVWKGELEETSEVLIFTDSKKLSSWNELKKLVSKLARHLQQEAILVTLNGQPEFIAA